MMQQLWVNTLLHSSENLLCVPRTSSDVLKVKPGIIGDEAATSLPQHHKSGAEQSRRSQIDISLLHYRKAAEHQVLA